MMVDIYMEDMSHNILRCSGIFDHIVEVAEIPIRELLLLVPVIDTAAMIFGRLFVR